MEILWILLTFAAVWNQAFGTCPRPDRGQYYQLGTWCYIARGLTENTRETFKDADAACKKLDPQSPSASLAVIDRYGVQSLLTAMLFSVSMSNSNAWVGLSQGIWSPDLTWANGSNVGFTNWASGQPSGPTLIPGFSQDCVEMVSDRQYPGLWYDIPCSKKNAYFCQVPSIDDEIHLPTTECELPYYVKFSTSCFRVYTNYSTAEEARKICAQDSSNDDFLATVDNSYENAFLNYLLILQVPEPTEYMVWIGLNQNSVAGPFTWEDDYPSRFTSWAKNMPNSYREKKSCTYMTNLGPWSTGVCGNKLPFICKFRLGGHHPPTPPPPPINSSCPDRWNKHDSNCYLLKPVTSKLTHDQAQYDCFLNYGARLASIHSGLQNRFIRKLMEDGGHITLWIGLKREYDQFKWEDGSLVDFAFWEDEPKDNSYKCVVMDRGNLGGSWRKEHCTGSANYACMMPQYSAGNPPLERRKEIRQVTSPEGELYAAYCRPNTESWTWGSLETSCPGSKGWVISGDYCYLFSDSETQGQKSWREAETWCNTNAGYLASLSTPQEQDFIKKLKLHNSPMYWIGLRETSNNHIYKWSDNSDFDFKFWEEGEPYDFAGELTCVELNMAFGGKWSSQYCGVRQNFICKKVWNATSAIISPTEPPISGGCPDGWIQAKTKCFKFYLGDDNKKTWMEAAAECAKNEDGHLASIANKAEQALLDTFMEPMDKPDDEATIMWIGLNSIGSNNNFERRYHWSDGSLVEYKHWAPFYPRYSTSPCVRNGNKFGGPNEWKTTDCTKKAEFACTKPASPAYKPRYLDTCKKSNYIALYDSCYWLDPKPRTFDDAADFCSANGSTLATISDFIDSSVVRFLFYMNNDVKDTWIGLRKNKETDAFSWADHWPVVFTAWGVNQPSGDNTAGHQCVHVAFDEDAYWFTSPCNKLRPTLCKYTSRTPPGTVPPITNGVCPDSTWIAWGTHCYMFISRYTMSWLTAANQCGDDGMLSIHSKAENAFITAQAKAKLGAGSSIWIGLRRKRNGFLSWDFFSKSKQPSSVDYVNWHPKEVLENATSDCTQLLLSENGLWRLSPCNEEVYVVCTKSQKDGPGATHTSPTSPTDGSLSGAALSGIILGASLAVAVVLVGIPAVLCGRRGRASFGHRDTTPIVDNIVF